MCRILEELYYENISPDVKAFIKNTLYSGAYLKRKTDNSSKKKAAERRLKAVQKDIESAVELCTQIQVSNAPRASG